MLESTLNPNGEPWEILAVDDTPGSLKLLTDILTESGYHVRPASSGQFALRSISSRLPDLILLDVKMPEIDGYEVCQQLKSMDQSKEIPVIFVSSLEEVTDKVKAFEAGGVDFITKPYQPSEVKARVKTHLAIHSLQKKLEEQNVVLMKTQDELENRVRKRTAALHASEQRFSLAMQGANDGLWDWDIETGMVYFSPRWKSMIGYDEDEISPELEEWESRIHPDDAVAVKEKTNTILLGQSDIFKFEFRMRCKSGSYIWILSRGFAVHNEDGRPVRFVGTHVDITDLVAIQDQLRQSQRMEAVGQLTGGVAHDFNNLLGIIIGNTDMLEYEIGEDERAKENVGAIIRAVERAASLINRLLAFSRQQPLSPETVSISNLITGLVDMLQRTLGETVDMRVDSDLNTWPAMIDPHQFENALINLALNARDAMSHGGVLTIRTTNVTLDEDYVERYEELEPGDYVEVIVSDTGAGMPLDVLEKVFEPFFTTKDVGEGSGLGLSMVYGFVKQSNGHITINSEKNLGTTVKLYMPRSTKAVFQGDTEVDLIEFEQGTERVLVVEDDKEFRKIPVNILRAQGYEVVEAGNGEEALKCLKDHQPFDLLFTDVVLPGGVNGVEIAEQVKKIQPSIKVLYATGYTEHPDMLVPGVSLLGKPYRRVELLEMVRTIIDSGGE